MTVSIIMPVYNGASTLAQTLESLFSQDCGFDELIVVNDGSSDRSAEIISDFCRKRDYRHLRLINHESSKGLAFSYNQAIGKATSELVVTLHQDVILTTGSLPKLIKPFTSGNPEIVASYHCVLHPMEIWERYNFWQKCFFARLVNKKFCGLDGKFDCFRKPALIKVGLFDQKHFRTAGEDGDIINRLTSIGRLVATEAEIVHLHRADNNFGPRQIILKQAQYSEAQGVMLRKGIIKEPVQLLRAFFRELLLLSLFLPYVRFLGIAMIAVYCIWYTKIIFVREWRNPRVLFLPLLNVFLLLVSAVYSASGFIRGRQLL